MKEFKKDDRVLLITDNKVYQFGSRLKNNTAIIYEVGLTSIEYSQIVDYDKLEAADTSIIGSSADRDFKLMQITRSTADNLTPEKRRHGDTNGKFAVVIDERTTVFIDDPSKAEETRKKYYKAIYGKEYKELHERRDPEPSIELIDDAEVRDISD